MSYGPPFGYGPFPKEKISYPLGMTGSDWGAFPESDEDVHDVQIAQWAIRQLKSSRNRPFFLGVGFYRPHLPMYAPRKWFDMHPRPSVELPPAMAGDRDDLSERDIKSGPGAIRTVEFFVQSLQIRFGKDFPEILSGHTLRALETLGDAQLLSRRECGDLQEAYVFLRMIEHRIQLLGLQQRHLIPEGEEELTCLAKRMGFEDRLEETAKNAFLRRLREIQERVKDYGKRTFQE